MNRPWNPDISEEKEQEALFIGHMVRDLLLQNPNTDVTVTFSPSSNLSFQKPVYRFSLREDRYGGGKQTDLCVTEQHIHMYRGDIRVHALQQSEDMTLKHSGRLATSRGHRG